MDFSFCFIIVIRDCFAFIVKWVNFYCGLGQRRREGEGENNRHDNKYGYLRVWETNIFKTFFDNNLENYNSGKFLEYEISIIVAMLKFKLY